MKLSLGSIGLAALLFGGIAMGSQPPIWTANPIDGGLAVANQAYTFDLGNFIQSGPGISALHCRKVSGPAWLVVDGTCETSGTPSISDGDVAVNSFVVRVTDDKGQSADTTFNIKVGVALAQPPVWSTNPIIVSATAGQTFTLNLGTYVTSPGGSPLSCTLVSGGPTPAWLVLGGCTVTGTPSSADIGTSELVVRATDGNGLSSDDTISMIVVSPSEE